MTTIAYRDGIIAADTCVSPGRRGHATKIAKRRDGHGGFLLAGACGFAIYSEAFLRWFENGEQGSPPEARQVNNACDIGMIIRARNRCELFEPGGSYLIRGDYFAIGSGSPEANGAMFTGATAETAVRAAMAHDENTWGEIQLLRADIW